MGGGGGGVMEKREGGTYYKVHYLILWLKYFFDKFKSHVNSKVIPNENRDINHKKIYIYIL